MIQLSQTVEMADVVVELVVLMPPFIQPREMIHKDAYVFLYQLKTHHTKVNEHQNSSMCVVLVAELKVLNR